MPSKESECHRLVQDNAKRISLLEFLGLCEPGRQEFLKLTPPALPESLNIETDSTF